MIISEHFKNKTYTYVTLICVILLRCKLIATSNLSIAKKKEKEEDTLRIVKGYLLNKESFRQQGVLSKRPVLSSTKSVR